MLTLITIKYLKNREYSRLNYRKIKKEYAHPAEVGCAYVFAPVRVKDGQGFMNTRFKIPYWEPICGRNAPLERSRSPSGRRCRREPRLDHRGRHRRNRH